MATDRGERRLWADWAVLLALMALALALRWRYVREISLFVDEFVTAWAGQNVLARGLPIFPSGNFYPHGPTFTYLEAPFLANGFDETLARAPGVLVGLAVLPAAYWAGRRLLSPAAGLIAAAALAVDPDAIVWGARARMYGLLQLLALLTVFFFYRGLFEDRPRDRYLAMGLLFAAIFTHAEAAFLLPVLGLAALMAWPWRRLLRPSVVLPFALGLAGALAYYLLARFGQQEHLETLQDVRPYMDLGWESLLSGPQTFAPVFTRLHRLPFTLLALAGLVFVLRPRLDRQSSLAYLILVLSGFTALIVSLAAATWRNERYLFLVLPWLFLAGGEVLWRLLQVVRPRLHVLGHAWAAAPALLAAGTALFGGLAGSRLAFVQVSGYDLAFRALQERLEPGDVILTPMPTAAVLILGRLDYFAIQQGYEEFVVSRPGDGVPADLWTATPILTQTAEFLDVLASAPRVWFVVDGWRLQTRYDPDFILTLLAHLEKDYDERGVMIFRGEGLHAQQPPEVQRERRADFGGELALDGFGLSAAHPVPGDVLEVTLDWQKQDGAKQAYTVFLHLVAADGTGVAGIDEPVLGGLYQPDLWPKGRTFPDRHRLALPPDLPPGHYRLDLGLYHSDKGDELPVEGQSRIALTYLAVGETAPSPPPSHLQGVDFGGQIRMLGYDWTGKQLTLHWQALAPVGRDYTVFVQLLGPDGAIVAQDDRLPAGEFYPTSAWPVGEIILSRHTIQLPADAPAGELQLIAGLYHRPSGERLPAVDAAGRSLGDAVMLTTIDMADQPIGEAP